MSSPEIQKPEIFRDEAGCPASSQFGDIYASRQGAVAQANSVFLHGNGLPGRWRKREQFVILENGFGLGTNFLATLQAWRKDPERSERLHFVSIEKFPATAEQLREFAQPGVEAEAAELADKWPHIVPGVHRIYFENGHVTLTLYFMDAAQAVRKLALGYDALYLDGFSPKVNEAMWAPGLLKAFARYAREGATLATWCVSSQVRDALAGGGFEIQKVPGFGNKKWMTKGIFAPRYPHRRFIPPEAVPMGEDKRVIVIGAGLSGAAIAEKLSRRGMEVSVIYDGCVPASEASAIRWGMLHSQFSSDDNYLFQLTRAGVEHTSLALKDFPECFDKRGLFQMARDQEEFDKWKTWEEQTSPFLAENGLAKLIDSQEAGDLTGLQIIRGGLWHRDAGLICAPVWVRKRLEKSGVCLIPNTRIGKIVFENNRWKVFDENEILRAEAARLVVAAGTDSVRLLQKDFPVKNWKGRISILCEQDLPNLKGGVTGRGYAVRSEDGWVACGASYEEEGKAGLSQEEAHVGNLQKLQSFSPEPLDATAAAFFEGMRSVAVDRMPIIGKVDFTSEGGESVIAFASFAMGSRAITLAELGAEIVVAEMFGEPLPIDRDLLRAVSPERFLKKASRRGG